VDLANVLIRHLAELKARKPVVCDAHFLSRRQCGN